MTLLTALETEASFSPSDLEAALIISGVKSDLSWSVNGLMLQRFRFSIYN
jgi:hypothetical protein